jgi:hypothetical protein
MTENSLLIRSRRRAKALPPASEADCDAADLKKRLQRPQSWPFRGLHLENVG